MKIYKLKAIMLLLGTAVTVAACGSTVQDASEANFTHALNSYYANHPECITLPRTDNEKGYDYIAKIADDRTPLGKQRNESDLKPFVELAGLGIYTAETTELEEKFFSQIKKVPAMGFKLTDQAKARLFIPTSRHEQFMGSGPKLCYGRREFTLIENFTEPAEAIGVTASQVKYHYRIADVADWATSLERPTSFSHVKNALGAELEDQDDMVLTDKGWVHHKAFKQ